MWFQKDYSIRLIFILFYFILNICTLVVAEDLSVVELDQRDTQSDLNNSSGNILDDEMVDLEAIDEAEAEDPELVGSVLNVDIDEANKVKNRVGENNFSLGIEDSKSFLFSILMIVVSEVGDKTFFIAAIMAMKNSRFLVFSAAFSALALMSILSAVLGHAVPNLIPESYTNYLASLLFLFFGIKMGFEGWQMTDEDAKQELEEVTAELKEKEETGVIDKAEGGGSVDKTKESTFNEGLINLCQFLFSPIFVQTFVLTFLAEWGDRSQIATIVLAAAQDVYWVTLGTIAGHSICTGLAVVGGRFLAAKISVKTVTIIGAFLFISFALIYLYEGICETGI
ncbi:9107_t:CDS:2 [Entrophospora sp. SA101]|nr:9107_t:CDS:2 [Entrophospora sp. SA101]CAJ0880255.1 14515_t:CDS:2 [Entrophospora sp. SA101]